MADLTLSDTAKTCTTCGVEKPATLEHFYRFAQGKHGLHPRCKECTKADMRNRAALKRSLVPIATQPAFKCCSKCAISLPIASFRVAKKGDKSYARGVCLECERIGHRERNRTRYVEQREDVLAANNEWRAANREIANRSVAAWHKAHPDVIRANRSSNNAKRKGAPGHHVASDIALQLSTQEGLCFYCGDELESYHVDHFIPLSRGGTNWPSNLRLACPGCNMRKSSKMPWEFMPSRFPEQITVVG